MALAVKLDGREPAKRLLHGIDVGPRISAPSVACLANVFSSLSVRSYRRREDQSHQRAWKEIVARIVAGHPAHQHVATEDGAWEIALDRGIARRRARSRDPVLVVRNHVVLKDELRIWLAISEQHAPCLHGGVVVDHDSACSC